MHCRYHGPIAGMAASQQLFLDASAHIKASDLIEVGACFGMCIFESAMLRPGQLQVAHDSQASMFAQPEGTPECIGLCPYKQRFF